jgi:toxin YhaV
MMDRRRTGGERRQGDRRAERPRAARSAEGVEVHGWTVLAHPLFIGAIERLTEAAEGERRAQPDALPGANAKLLAHLLDLAFDKVPRDPGNPAYRHGGTLGENRKHWFRAKTGNGRYRLFYRFQTSARIIVYAWVNDENSLRTYGNRTDAYAVFAGMIDDGNPPDDWDALFKAASERGSMDRLRKLMRRSSS